MACFPKTSLSRAKVVLDDKERAELERVYASPAYAKDKEKARALLLATEGIYSYEMLAGIVRRSRATVVNWFRDFCVKWCNAHSEMARQTPCYTVGGAVYKTGVFGSSGSDIVTCDFAASGYRLPTVTEWEYAARGGL